MKRLLIAIVLMGIAGTAGAQTTPAAHQPYQGYDETRAYIGAIVGATFGNKTGTIYGVEAGIKLLDSYEIFIEGGRMTDVTTSGTQDAANAIGSFLAGLGKGSATWSATTPVNYGAVGARYLYPLSEKIEPYVAVSLGMANVEKKASFALNGSDVTGSLSSYGVQLGQDLSGKSNKFMATLGGGIRVNVNRLLFDAGIRYGRILTKPEGTNVFRIHVGAGYKF
jgi:hypothetical protein